VKKCLFRLKNGHVCSQHSLSLEFNLYAVLQSLAVTEREPKMWCCNMEAQKNVWRLHPSQQILTEMPS